MFKNHYIKRKNIIIVFALTIILVLTFFVSIALGRYPISPGEVLGIVFSKVFPIHMYWTERMETVFYQIRLPRILLAGLVGACLSCAGASYQGIFHNPMAAPDVLGASAGAAFGAALAILNHAGSKGITASAFLFSLITVTLVYFVSKKAKGSQVMGLILSGIMISSLFSAGTSYIKLVADPNEELPAITYWLMGSLSGVKLSDVLFALIPMLIGLIPLYFLRWQINVLTMGDEEAKTMGINTKFLRFIIIICATLITAASVSVSGMIGWVGLVIPHLSRRLVGNNYQTLLPVSLLFGATFLMIVDNLARNLWTSEIPIGILTSFIGAPFFLYLITREGNMV
jgi:iron complex transport system permease protein